VFAQVDVLLLPALPAPPSAVHDKTIKLGELELPVLRAMIYETFLLNMCGAPVVTLPDLQSTGGLAESVPFGFQIAGPHRPTIEVLSFSTVVASRLGAGGSTHSTYPA
jgi:Asp-tRNA(Asn)/Glu-tRNA(Gln) amidotransferase A subunit family amidase